MIGTPFRWGERQDVGCGWDGRRVYGLSDCIPDKSENERGFVFSPGQIIHDMPPRDDCVQGGVNDEGMV